MQTTPRAIFAIAILASAVSAATGQARAMPLASPAVSGAGSANAALILRVTNVCGVGGCVAVHTRRVQHQPVGFARRAAPIVIAKPGALPPENASK